MPSQAAGRMFILSSVTAKREGINFHRKILYIYIITVELHLPALLTLNLTYVNFSWSKVREFFKFWFSNQVRYAE